MSLLDDAIREHLELKRQRGADPTEVAREEHDALAPVPRPARHGQPASGPVAEYIEQPATAAPAPAQPAQPVSPTPPQPAAPLAPEPTSPFQPPYSTPPPPAPGPSTEEWALEDEEPAAPDSDVLESTPEFLQETPEHDRLWFEQKPPRDFDFDG